MCKWSTYLIRHDHTSDSRWACRGVDCIAWESSIAWQRFHVSTAAASAPLQYSETLLHMGKHQLLISKCRHAELYLMQPAL